jgi:hypothetical protein
VKSWKWPGKLKIQIWIIAALVFIIWISCKTPGAGAEGEGEMNELDDPEPARSQWSGFALALAALTVIT